MKYLLGLLLFFIVFFFSSSSVFASTAPVTVSGVHFDQAGKDNVYAFTWSIPANSTMLHLNVTFTGSCPDGDINNIITSDVTWCNTTGNKTSEWTSSEGGTGAGYEYDFVNPETEEACDITFTADDSKDFTGAYINLTSYSATYSGTIGDVTYIDIATSSAVATGIHDVLYVQFIFWGILLFIAAVWLGTFIFKG